MLKVHGRSDAEKKFVKLNKRGQPNGNRKTRSELSNFLGTLVKDHVSLTYVNWHVVPNDLKKQMLEYTLVTSSTLPLIYFSHIRAPTDSSSLLIHYRKGLILHQQGRSGCTRHLTRLGEHTSHV